MVVELGDVVDVVEGAVVVGLEVVDESEMVDELVESIVVEVERDDCWLPPVVGTISGAVEASLTPPEASATTHHVAKVTRVVASTQPRM
ncbi:MAG: hypothetical protein DWQ40_13810 [Actinobacteria bacterium]|nr:MAG: hypothetical protein DWQ40_13810 [Actinomycetota bacterium]